jgi:hypothetical protein
LFFRSCGQVIVRFMSAAGMATFAQVVTVKVGGKTWSEGHATTRKLSVLGEHQSMSVSCQVLEQYASSCPECKGANLWAIIQWNGTKKYCLDCYFQCDCGEKFRRGVGGKCPSCKDPQSSQADSERVAEWIALIQEGHVSTQRLENLGRIGPAGRAALPLLKEILAKEGTGGFLGAAAQDAIREHALNAHVADPVEPPPKAEEPVASPPVAEKIRFPCPKCAKAVSVRAEHAGKRGKCPGCGSVVAIPSGA